MFQRREFYRMNWLGKGVPALLNQKEITITETEYINTEKNYKNAINNETFPSEVLQSN